jgi:hypothetical protein
MTDNVLSQSFGSYSEEMYMIVQETTSSGSYALSEDMANNVLSQPFGSEDLTAKFKKACSCVSFDNGLSMVIIVSPSIS